MMTANMASSKLPLNPKTKVHDETEEPKKISGNIFFRNQIRKIQDIKNYQMEKERLQGFLRENRIPPNRHGFYGQYIHNLEGKIADAVKDIKDD
jgi:hypothetical protein